VKPYTNTISQAERAAILKNDLRQNTLLGRAASELFMEERGRFAKPSVVIADAGAPTYPSAAPWTQSHVPDEPPLGFDVNAIEPVGEHFELEIEIERSRASSVAASHDVDRDHGAGAAPSQPPSAPATLWRRPL
jgi:hypothetical protein